MTSYESPSEQALAAGVLDRVDEDLLEEIARFYERADPVPATLVERIQFGITLDALHAELASLTRIEPELAGARGEATTGVQTVTFSSPSLTTMVTITPTTSDLVRIDGWIAPGTGVRVELRIIDESRTAVADEDGRFVFEDVPHGFGQFLLRPAGPNQLPVVITPSMEF